MFAEKLQGKEKEILENLIQEEVIGIKVLGMEDNFQNSETESQARYILTVSFLLSRQQAFKHY